MPTWGPRECSGACIRAARAAVEQVSSWTRTASTAPYFLNEENQPWIPIGHTALPRHAECFAEFVEDVGGFLRAYEQRVHGPGHPQTLSVFTPHIVLDDR